MAYKGIKESGGMSRRWWAEDKGDAYKYIFETVTNIWNTTNERQERNLRCLRLYGNADYVGMSPYSISKAITPVLPDNRVKVNVVASMCETVAARISKMKPRVTFLTSGGEYSVQERAKNLSKFAEGLFYQNQIYDLHQKGFKDATVFDIGAVKHYVDYDQKKICSERVLANELFIDDVDGMYGKPRTLYQVKFIHKDILQEMFPKKKASIAMSSNTLNPHIATPTAAKDYVVVVEAWHLPTGKDSGDGLHVICTDKDNLQYEEYKKDYFPFTWFRWSPRLVGFWGQSLADRLTGNQIEINKMLRVIQKAFHLGSSFKVFLEHGSKIAKEHLNNEIGGLVYYTGTPPTYYVPNVISPEYFNHLNFLIKSSYEEAGVSQLSASSKKPEGLDSGKAIREYSDVETERFAIVSQAYEATFLETARQYIDLAKEMHEEGIDYEVKAESKRFLETIKWSEIEIDDNEFILKAFPTSMLPHTPAGRLQMVEDLTNAGYISKEQAIRLLDFPDLDSYTSLINSPLDDLMAELDNILSKGEYRAPEPYQDLVSGVRLFQSAYLRARREKVPEDRLDLLRRWMSTATAMIEKAKAAQAPAPQPMALPQQAPQAPTSTGGAPV